MSRQFALDLRHRAAAGREAFLVSGCNSAAVAGIARWPDWPGPALVLAGPPGSGKSHLAEVWRTRSGARLLGSGPAFGPGGPGPGARVVVDDADLRDDEEVLHLHNAVAERGGSLLVAAREPPARWRGRLPDLVSRLAAATTVRIGEPDDALLAAVVVKMLADQRLDVPANVLNYLLARMERSFEAAGALAAEINRLSLATGRGATVPLAREALERLGARAGVSRGPPDPA